MEKRDYPSVELEKSLEMSLLSFPEKLWELVNDPKCNEITWNYDGASIVIPNVQNFITEILNNPSKPIFKTKNFASFVRQLNLYGFRKITAHSRKQEAGRTVFASKSQFKHPCFVKGNRELLQDVSRRYQSNRRGDQIRKQANALYEARGYPCGLVPPMNQFTHWPLKPFYSAYYNQFSSPSAYLPFTRQFGLCSPQEMQHLGGPVMPLDGVQPDLSAAHSPLPNPYHTSATQLHGAGRVASSSTDRLNNYTCRENVTNAGRQDLTSWSRANSVAIQDGTSDLRRTVVVIDNSTQAQTDSHVHGQPDKSHLQVPQTSSNSRSQDFINFQGAPVSGSGAYHRYGYTSGHDRSAEYRPGELQSLGGKNCFKSQNGHAAGRPAEYLENKPFSCRAQDSSFVESFNA